MSFEEPRKSTWPTPPREYGGSGSAKVSSFLSQHLHSTTSYHNSNNNNNMNRNTHHDGGDHVKMVEDSEINLVNSRFYNDSLASSSVATQPPSPPSPPQQQQQQQLLRTSARSPTKPTRYREESGLHFSKQAFEQQVEARVRAAVAAKEEALAAAYQQKEAELKKKVDNFKREYKNIVDSTFEQKTKSLETEIAQWKQQQAQKQQEEKEQERDREAGYKERIRHLQEQVGEAENRLSDLKIEMEKMRTFFENTIHEMADTKEVLVARHSQLILELKDEHERRVQALTAELQQLHESIMEQEMMACAAVTVPSPVKLEVDQTAFLHSEVEKVRQALDRKWGALFEKQQQSYRDQVMELNEAYVNQMETYKQTQREEEEARQAEWLERLKAGNDVLLQGSRARIAQLQEAVALKEEQFVELTTQQQHLQREVDRLTSELALQHMEGHLQKEQAREEERAVYRDKLAQLQAAYDVKFDQLLASRKGPIGGEERDCLSAGGAAPAPTVSLALYEQSCYKISELEDGLTQAKRAGQLAVQEAVLAEQQVWRARLEKERSELEQVDSQRQAHLAALKKQLLEEHAAKEKGIAKKREDAQRQHEAELQAFVRKETAAYELRVAQLEKESKEKVQRLAEESEKLYQNKWRTKEKDLDGREEALRRAEMELKRAQYMAEEEAFTKAQKKLHQARENFEQEMQRRWHELRQERELLVEKEEQVEQHYLQQYETALAELQQRCHADHTALVDFFVEQLHGAHVLFLQLREGELQALRHWSTQKDAHAAAHLQRTLQTLTEKFEGELETTQDSFFTEQLKQCVDTLTQQFERLDAASDSKRATHWQVIAEEFQQQLNRYYTRLEAKWEKKQKQMVSEFMAYNEQKQNGEEQLREQFETILDEERSAFRAELAAQKDHYEDERKQWEAKWTATFEKEKARTEAQWSEKYARLLDQKVVLEERLVQQKEREEEAVDAVQDRLVREKEALRAKLEAAHAAAVAEKEARLQHLQQQVDALQEEKDHLVARSAYQSYNQANAYTHPSYTNSAGTYFVPSQAITPSQPKSKQPQPQQQQQQQQQEEEQLTPSPLQNRADVNRSHSNGRGESKKDQLAQLQELWALLGVPTKQQEAFTDYLHALSTATVNENNSHASSSSRRSEELRTALAKEIQKYKHQLPLLELYTQWRVLKEEIFTLSFSDSSGAEVQQKQQHGQQIAEALRAQIYEYEKAHGVVFLYKGQRVMEQIIA